MKSLITVFIVLLSVQTFARDHQEDRGRADRASENRRRNEENRRRHDSDVGIFDISNTLILSSLTFDEKVEAEQVINDSQEFMQSGKLSILLDQKIAEVQSNNEDLSLEDALDLIVASAETKL